MSFIADSGGGKSKHAGKDDFDNSFAARLILNGDMLHLNRLWHSFLLRQDKDRAYNAKPAFRFIRNHGMVL